MAAHWKRLLFGETLSPELHSSAGSGINRLATTGAISLIQRTLLLVVPVLMASAAFGQSFPRTLNDIRLFGRGESIQMTFSQPYEGTPSEEYAPGRFALTFVGVGSQKPVRDLKPREESLFKEIHVVQNRYSTTVTFLLRDPALNLKDRLSYKPGRDVLNIELALNGTAAASPAPLAVRPAGEPLLSELEQKIGGMPAQKPAEGTAAPQAPMAAPGAKSVASSATPSKPTATTPAKPVQAQVPVPATSGIPATAPTAAPSAPAAQAPATATAPIALGGMPDGNFFASLVTMIVALALLLGGMYAVLWLYKKYFHSRLARFAGTPSLRQVASFSIGPRQRIVVLEINGELIACGVTPSQITFLTRLTGDRPAAQGESTGTEVAATDSAEAHPVAPSAKPDPVHQFAEVLKQKVRSLKRIN